VRWPLPVLNRPGVGAGGIQMAPNAIRALDCSIQIVCPMSGCPTIFWCVYRVPRHGPRLKSLIEAMPPGVENTNLGPLSVRSNLLRFRSETIRARALESPVPCLSKEL